MRPVTTTLSLALSVALIGLGARGAQAQTIPLGLELRGGFNFATSDLRNGLGETEALNPFEAEQGGWSAAGDLYWTFHRYGAIYVGYSYAHFDCKDEECGVDGSIISDGPEAGLKFSLERDRAFTPWARLGIIAHEARFEESGAPREETNRTIGLEAAIGTDIDLGETISLVPAIRFYRYNAAWDLGSIDQGRVNKNIGWFQADVGMMFDLSSFSF